MEAARDAHRCARGIDGRVARADRDDETNQEKIAVLLHRFCEENRRPLGLAEDVPLAVRSFHHAVRLLGAELETAQDFVCEVTQTKEVPVFPGRASRPPSAAGRRS